MHIKYAMCAYTELRKNISIDEKTWERLKGYGKFGESFDDLINRLLSEIDQLKGANKQKK